MKVKYTAFVLFVLTVVSVHASDVLWTGGGDGTNWHDGGNWNPGLPGNADNAVISLNGAVVACTSNETIDQLTMGNAVNSSQTLNILSGTLTIDGTNIYSIIGVQDGAMSSVNQLGGSVVITNAGELYIGAEDTGRSCTSIWTIASGSLYASELNLGQRGTADAKSSFIQSGGIVIITNLFSMGKFSNGSTDYTMTGGALILHDGDGFANYTFCVGRERPASFNLYGGAVTNYDSLRLGEFQAGHGHFTITNGHFDCAGTLEMSRADSSGTFYQYGGVTEVGKALYLKRGANNSGRGKIIFKGGSFSCVEDVWMQPGGTGIIEVAGSGCTNISFGEDLLLNNGCSSIRALVDGGGLSTMKVIGNADLSTNRFEIGIDTNSFDSKVGDFWTLIRVPNTQSLITNDITCTNLNAPDYLFELSTVGTGGYNSVIITCTYAPPKATVIIVR